MYNTTHVIRLLIIQRCETTLSWDQLRSPQVSQFLVKPIQQQIRTNQFSRCTLYALLANCLQFNKEAQQNPGNVGVLRTRAMTCELLAIRLLKEYNTRELIDALSYDFDPLQGLTPPGTSGTATPRMPRAARTSTVEVAIRTQSKRFLAHPVVVQQLEAIWAGTIVFHSAADSLHRAPVKLFSRQRGYGTMPQATSAPDALLYLRRSVTLYDPREASLFKLSRLRVPRYRQLFSTLSLAIMLGLFLGVLMQRSLDITALEIVFWFWSAGYMLDEVVGFTEQGFELYIMSVWNAFDLGILMLFVAYYILRLYGILIPTVRKHYVANMAYDVLAATAVLLFPRLFSVLDHYRYFSQLLIAFRGMAVDLVAILVLIIISCSGFFIAFTLSFGDEALDAGAAAYALFQMLMGFTPAAWEIWPGYNALGKLLLTLFLFICHFLIVTILVTVLTNSFMAVVQNANEEHQFLFAVNTISMVKSDALFSYVAPTNILGWLLTPARYFLPFRQFVKLNRTVIKVTHIPILFTIFGYERLFLSRRAFGPTDLVEQRGREPTKGPAFSLRGPGELFSPDPRLREPSIATFQKDRALEEVFRRPFRGDSTVRQAQDTSINAHRSSNVVHNWMNGMGQQGGADEPQEEPRSVLDRLEERRLSRPLLRRAKTSQRVVSKRDWAGRPRSTASDPEEPPTAFKARPKTIPEIADDLDTEDIPQQTDADGDDELLTNDDDQFTIDRATGETEQDSDKENRTVDESDFYQTPRGAIARVSTPNYPDSVSSANRPLAETSTNQMVQRALKRPRHHSRQASAATMLFSPTLAPKEPRTQPASRSPSPKRPTTTHKSGSGTATGTATPGRRRSPAGRRTPRRQGFETGVIPSYPRPIPPPRNLPMPQDIGGLLAMDRRKPSFNARALDLASDLGDNRYGPNIAQIGAMPMSFGTQLEGMKAMRRTQKTEEEREEDEEANRRMNRLVLARMSTLEQGFREVLNEVKDWRRTGGSGSVGSMGSVVGPSAAHPQEDIPRERKRGKKKRSRSPEKGKRAEQD